MPERVTKNCIVVCGPTASGKTHLGVEIALQKNGEIISADSRQVYRGMDIGTGKDRGEYVTKNGKIETHLIDIVEPEQVYTVYHYQRDFYPLFDSIIAREHVPIIVGGTGLYIEAVLRSYKIPLIPENPELRTELMAEEKAWLEAELLRRAPGLFARTDLSSKKRIVRSIEIAMGPEPIPEDVQHKSAINPIVLCVTWERAILRERIEKRLRERMNQGLIEEVQRLLASGISKERFALFGMEYKHIGNYVRGAVDYDTMFMLLLQDIRRFAKRQDTYFRGMERRGIEVHWVKEADNKEAFEIISRFDI